MGVAINSLGASGLELDIQDKLESSDYERFTVLTKDRIKNHGEVNLLVRASSFRGWSPAALWQDLKFDVAHYRDVFRVAVVAEDPSREWMATLSRPFKGASVEFFPASEIDAARAWIKGAVRPRP